MFYKLCTMKIMLFKKFKFKYPKNIIEIITKINFLLILSGVQHIQSLKGNTNKLNKKPGRLNAAIILGNQNLLLLIFKAHFLVKFIQTNINFSANINNSYSSIFLYNNEIFRR